MSHTGELDGLRIRVHEEGNHSLDGLLQLVELATSTDSLGQRLARMCATAAALTEVEVVSVYVRERSTRNDVLVLRGNIGFATSAIDATRLEVGEGLTGAVAQRVRPISAAVADRDHRYKHIDGIGEESFPSYLGIPILDGPEACGVLVFQRRAPGAFSDAFTARATALAAPFALAIAKTATPDTSRRSARLRGIPLVAGAALGRTIALPTLAALDNVIPGKATVTAVLEGLEHLELTLHRARTRLAACANRAVDRALQNLELVLGDRRFRERLQQEVAAFGLLAGLTNTARDYARVRYLVSGGADMSALLSERAQEVEALCVLLHAHVGQRTLLQRGCVVVANRLGAFVALTAASREAAAIVTSHDVAHDSAAAAIATASDIPVVSSVQGLFSWSRPGDLVMVDGDGGSVDINPATEAVAEFRKRAQDERKRSRAARS